MLKKILSVLLLACVVTLTLTSCGVPVAELPEKPEDIPVTGLSPYDLDSDVFTQVAENDDLILYYNELTTDIKVKVKATGYEWTTECVNGDFVSRGEIFNIDYYSSTSGVHSLSSVDSSIERGQFRMTPVENGVKVQYGIGYVNFELKHPHAISESRYEEFSSKMSEEEKYLLASAYRLIDFNSQSFLDELPEQQAADKLKYPLADNPQGEAWYYKNSTNDETAILLNEAFANAGYTEKDLAHDNEFIAATETTRPEFAFSIYYTLNGNSLSVRMPLDEVYYTENYMLERISLLPNFTEVAGGMEGYFLLPDGSGSIMNFNNCKNDLRTESVYVPIYGLDKSKTVTSSTTEIQQAVFPVYGTYVNDNGAKTYVDEWAAPSGKKKNQKPTGKNAVFTIIEDGETFSGITANVGNDDLENQFNYNQAYVDFRLNEKTDIAAFSTYKDSSVYSIHQFELYDGDIKLAYHFLTGDDANYSSMADMYSDYLFGEDGNIEPTDYYSTVELLGQINVDGNFLGVSYDTKEALTTFDEAAEIAKDLKDSGMNNMNVKLSGWFNGGYEHGYIDNISVASKLGGKDGLKNLISQMKELGIDMYVDADIQNVYMAEDKVGADDALVKINRKPLVVSNFDFVRFTETNIFAKQVLNIDAVKNSLSGFLADYEEYDNKFVSFRNIGSELFGNFEEGEKFMERQEMMQNLVSVVADVKEQGYSVMGSVGQAPFVKHLDIINDVPVISTSLDKTDYSVPFTGMVLSGHLDYTNKPLNLNNSDRADLLHLIEAGAGVNFMLTANTYEKISQSDYQHLYSTEYDKLKTNIFDAYNYVAEAQEKTYGVEIRSHEQIADGVYCTTYKNGVSTYVNYTDEDYKVDRNITVGALDYTVSEEGE